MSGCCSVAFGAKGRFHQMWAWWPNFSSMIIVQTNCIIQKCHTSLISCPNIIQKYRLVTEKSAVVLISHWTITLDYNCWCVCSRWPLPTTTMWGLLLHLLMSLNNRHMVSLNSLCLSLSVFHVFLLQLLQSPGGYNFVMSCWCIFYPKWLFYSVSFHWHES